MGAFCTLLWNSPKSKRQTFARKPMGMDGLSILDKIKAECANITYESTCELMRCLHYHQKWNAEVIDGRVIFPTRVEAAYPIFVVQAFGNNCKTQGTRAWCH